MQCFTCDRQAPYYTLASAKADFKITIFGHTQNYFLCGMLGTFQTRKWPTQLLMTSEGLGLSLQIILFSGIDRTVLPFKKKSLVLSTLGSN